MVPPLDVLCSRVVGGTPHNVDCTLIITIESKFALSNYQVIDKFLHACDFLTGFRLRPYTRLPWSTRPWSSSTWIATRQLQLHTSLCIQTWINWYLHQPTCANLCILPMWGCLSRNEDTHSRCLSRTEVSTSQQSNALFWDCSDIS